MFRLDSYVWMASGPKTVLFTDECLSVFVFKSTRTWRHKWVLCCSVCTKTLIAYLLAVSFPSSPQQICVLPRWANSFYPFLLSDVKMRPSLWCSLLAQKWIQPGIHDSAFMCTFWDKKSFRGHTFFGQMATGWVFFGCFVNKNIPEMVNWAQL